MAECKVKVFEVLYDHPTAAGPAADGAHIQRFRGSERTKADTFAAANTCYGRPAQVGEVNVRRSLAQRWGVA